MFSAQQVHLLKQLQSLVSSAGEPRQSRDEILQDLIRYVSADKATSGAKRRKTNEGRVLRPSTKTSAEEKHFEELHSYSMVPPRSSARSSATSQQSRSPATTVSSSVNFGTPVLRPPPLSPAALPVPAPVTKKLSVSSKQNVHVTVTPKDTLDERGVLVIDLTSMTPPSSPVAASSSNATSQQSPAAAAAAVSVNFPTPSPKREKVLRPTETSAEKKLFEELDELLDSYSIVPPRSSAEAAAARSRATSQQSRSPATTVSRSVNFRAPLLRAPPLSSAALPAPVTEKLSVLNKQNVHATATPRDTFDERGVLVIDLTSNTPPSSPIAARSSNVISQQPPAAAASVSVNFPTPPPLLTPMSPSTNASPAPAPVVEEASASSKQNLCDYIHEFCQKIEADCDEPPHRSTYKISI